MQLIIKYNDIYEVDGIKYFKYQYKNRIYRNINYDLSKNPKYKLEQIANYCQLKFNYKLIKKFELLELISNSNCLKLENNINPIL